MSGYGQASETKWPQTFVPEGRDSLQGDPCEEITDGGCKENKVARCPDIVLVPGKHMVSTSHCEDHARGDMRRATGRRGSPEGSPFTRRYGVEVDEGQVIARSSSESEKRRGDDEQTRTEPTWREPVALSHVFRIHDVSNCRHPKYSTVNLSTPVGAQFLHLLALAEPLLFHRLGTERFRPPCLVFTPHRPFDTAIAGLPTRIRLHLLDLHHICLDLVHLRLRNSVFVSSALVTDACRLALPRSNGKVDARWHFESESLRDLRQVQRVHVEDLFQRIRSI